MIREQNSQIKHLAQPQHTQQPIAVVAAPPPQKQIILVQQPVSPPRPCLGFILSWVLFILAVGVYAGIWAIANYLVTIQTSYYYNVDHHISPYITAQANQVACNLSVASTKYSSFIYTSDQLKTAQSVALYLVFTWLMWKLPMSLFILHLIYQSPNRIIKYVSWGVSLLIMLAVDILLTIFIPTIYQQYMFYAFTAILTVIVSVICNRPMYKAAIAGSFLPLFYIALLYFSYTYFIPALYGVIYDNLTDGHMYLIIYGYPVLDILFYIGLLLLNAKCPQICKPLLSFVQFFLLGYFCGITMLTSVTQVQFYYLCGYMLFRNFFANWVMWKWQAVVNNPPCLPGWGIVYYLSYLFNFVPLYGIGPLVISLGYKSTQFAQSCLLLYYYPSSEYPYTTATPQTGFNLNMYGYVFWPAALIIWVISTATQKYPRRMPTLFDFFYNMAGIYMFYIGISAGLELLVLRQIAFK